jgi:hypothetical protein
MILRVLAIVILVFGISGCTPKQDSEPRPALTKSVDGADQEFVIFYRYSVSSSSYASYYTATFEKDGVFVQGQGSSPENAADNAIMEWRREKERRAGDTESVPAPISSPPGSVV